MAVFMDNPPLSGYAVALILCLIVVVLLLGHALKQDPQEPPVLRPKIPIIGHLLGLGCYRMEYYRQLGQRNPDLPIFTLPMGLSKIYIISSPSLVQLAMRKSSLSFDPLMVAFADKMIGFGPNIMGLMGHSPSNRSGSWLGEQHRAYEPLLPGAALIVMNSQVLNSIAEILNTIGIDFETKKFYLWLRRAFTLATTSALFGARNPLTGDPELNESLWAYESGQINLLLQPFPSVTARRPYRSRAALQKALRAYFRSGHDQNPDVSAVIKSRVAVNKKWGLPIDDIADHELGMLFVSITNAIPTLFWMIFYVFQDAQLVTDLQVELLACIEEGEDGHGQRECTISIAKLSDACPHLNSTYREVMRMTNRQLGTRTVLEDTYLTYSSPGDPNSITKTYLLKKGVHVQMPSMITSYAQETWGNDALIFDSRRFMAGRDNERLRKKAFTPFGGGKHLCPGRHFAYAEILGTVAALVLGFEITSPEGQSVSVPPINDSIVEAVGKPLLDVQQKLLANIRRRPGWEEVNWRFVPMSKGVQS